MSVGNNDDDKSNPDLTRLEELSEFLHVEDSEVEDKFSEFSLSSDESLEFNLSENIESSDEALFSNNDFGDSPEKINFSSETDALTEELTMENILDSSFELSSEETINDFSNTEVNPFDVLPPETLKNEDFPLFGGDNKKSEQFTLSDDSQERFEDVKNFVSNFSYGQIEGGGNPPFTIIIRNIKYDSDALDIVALLREFEVINDENRQVTLNALSTGSYIIPQISEYSAIVLAHKLRRFDCDLEVGLSDEIRISKLGEANPRGLVKKEALLQNKKESYKKTKEETPLKDIIVSTMATLEGYIVKKYIGVKTSFTVVDEEELERLKFVQEAVRANKEIHNYDTEDAITSKKAFKDYQASFEFLFNDLSDQLKIQAMKEKANALLGLSYQLTSLPFEKSTSSRNCYQITCSATLAIVQAL